MPSNDKIRTSEEEKLLHKLLEEYQSVLKDWHNRAKKMNKAGNAEAFEEFSNLPAPPRPKRP